MRRIGYHAPHEQYAPGTLRDLAIRAEAAGFVGIKCSDHIQPWNGTNTTQPNGRLLCRYHHRLRTRLKHPPYAIRTPDGTLQHHRADSTPITDRPRRRGSQPT